MKHKHRNILFVAILLFVFAISNFISGNIALAVIELIFGIGILVFQQGE